MRKLFRALNWSKLTLLSSCTTVRLIRILLCRNFYFLKNKHYLKLLFIIKTYCIMQNHQIAHVHEYGYGNLSYMYLSIVKEWVSMKCTCSMPPITNVSILYTFTKITNLRKMNFKNDCCLTFHISEFNTVSRKVSRVGVNLWYCL